MKVSFYRLGFRDTLLKMVKFIFKTDLSDLKRVNVILVIDQ